MDAYNELTSKKFISQMDQPCPEVFRLKVFNEKFTRSLINLAEHVNEWSGGGCYCSLIIVIMILTSQWYTIQE